MSHKPSKPIFNGDQPRFPIKQPGANLAMASGNMNTGSVQGRSVSLANQIKKAELDLLNFEKSPFRNLKESFANDKSMIELPGGGALNENRIEEIINSKLGEFKESIMSEIRNRSISSGKNGLSDDEKKEIKELRENSKVHQNHLSQLINHLSQLSTAINELNKVVSLQTDRIGKLENSEGPSNSPENVYDSDIVKKISTFESQINELNENYNKLKNKDSNGEDKSIQNLKDEFAQKSSTFAEELENLNLAFGNELNNLKNAFSENLKKQEQQSLEINALASKIKAEHIKSASKSTNDETSPKWAEQVLKLEADLKTFSERNNENLKKNEFLNEMKGLRDRVEKLEKNVKNLEKIEKPIKEDKGIDNERFNMILEKTKRNIEMAMSTTPNLPSSIATVHSANSTPSKPDYPIKAQGDSADGKLEKLDDWFSKYQEEKTKLNQLLSEKLEVNADKISGIKPFDIHTNIETQINSLKSEDINENFSSPLETKKVDSIGFSDPPDNNEEVVYHLDEEGYLMDEHGNYIVDENEEMIKLTDEHIDYLRKSNMIEDDQINK